MTSGNELPPIHGHPSYYSQHSGGGPTQRGAEPRSQNPPLIAPAGPASYQGSSSHYQGGPQHYPPTHPHYQTGYDVYPNQSEQHGQFPPSGSFSQGPMGMHQDSQYHSHGFPPHQTSQALPERNRRGAQAQHPCVVGLPGYPPKSAPVEERTRFSPDDDGKLKHLKEERSLSWKQIADFFPGRMSGTLQVRYCTKLKDKESVNWTHELDERLRRAKREDESGKWARVAQKLGGGNVTPQACEMRWREVHEVYEDGRPAFDEADPTAYEDPSG